MEFLHILEQYREKCEMEGNYLEAARADEQLKTLKKQVRLLICQSLANLLKEGRKVAIILTPSGNRRRNGGSNP